MAGKGSATGERRGGRQKGTPNRRTEAQARAIAESGLTPLEYMTSVFRDTGQKPEVRLDAAGKAAPYVHPRLTSAKVEVEGSLMNRRPNEMTDRELFLELIGKDPKLLEEFWNFAEQRLRALAEAPGKDELAS